MSTPTKDKQQQIKVEMETQNNIESMFNCFVVSKIKAYINTIIQKNIGITEEDESLKKYFCDQFAKTNKETVGKFNKLLWNDDDEDSLLAKIQGDDGVTLSDMKDDIKQKQGDIEKIIGKTKGELETKIDDTKRGLEAIISQTNGGLEGKIDAAKKDLEKKIDDGIEKVQKLIIEYQNRNTRRYHWCLAVGITCAVLLISSIILLLI